MNVTKIEMDPQVAEEKIQAWLAERHVDQAVVKADCLKGYEALAAGKVLVHLDAAIRGGGFHASGFPKLAIARADREQVRFTWGSTSSVALYDTRDQFHSGRWSPTLRLNVQMMREPNVSVRRTDGSSYYRSLDGYSKVPLLPAECRPETGQLRDWFILWEAEHWYSRDYHAQPDRDPMLLEHVAGQLYAVLAEWELTELERAVMAGALREVAQ